MNCSDPDYRGREANFSHAVTGKVKNILQNPWRHATQGDRFVHKTVPLTERSNISRHRGFTRRVEGQRASTADLRYGRGAGVGRGRPTGLGLAVGEGLGVDVGVAVGVSVGVAVAVAVAVAVGVGVELAVGVGVGVPPVGPWIAAIIGEPVLKKPTVALELCGG